jgi:Skp family chaperone for outer membrane proteins
MRLSGYQSAGAGDVKSSPRDAVRRPRRVLYKDAEARRGLRRGRKGTAMSRRSMKAALLGLAAATLVGWQDAAAAGEAAPAPAAPASSLTGPLVPGVCLLSQEELIGRSQIGQAAMARLRSLSEAAQAAVEADKARLERDSNALGAQRASLAPAVFQARAKALNKRVETFQAQAAARQRQIEATRNKVLGRILETAQPFFAQAYAAHACGLLFSRNAVLGGNLGNDLTAETITAMDAKASPITFDLEPATASPAQ